MTPGPMRVAAVVAVLCGVGLFGVGLFGAGPGRAQTAETLPEGYPPLMGEVVATLGDAPVTWQTYDFSLGAFDASAWVGDTDDTVTLHIMAYPAGQPDAREGRLRIEAAFGLFPSPGATPDRAVIEVLQAGDIDGRKLTSGGTATLTLEAFSRTSYAYGRAKGTFEATLCLKRSKDAPLGRRCKPIKGRFDTAIQFDNM